MCVDYFITFSEQNYLSNRIAAKDGWQTQLLLLTGSNTPYVSSRLLAGRGVTVERARWTVTPRPAIFLRGNEMPGLQLLVQRLALKQLARDRDPPERKPMG